MEAGASARRNTTWENALALPREIPAAGLEPTVFHFNVAVSAGAARGRWRKAVNLLEELEKLPWVGCR